MVIVEFVYTFIKAIFCFNVHFGFKNVLSVFYLFFFYQRLYL